MSHSYSIYFTTKEGKFMGRWAIQDHFTRDKIETIKEIDPNAFKGDFYDIGDNHDVIEVEKWRHYWFNENKQLELKEGIDWAIKNNLRMFLG